MLSSAVLLGHGRCCEWGELWILGVLHERDVLFYDIDNSRYFVIG